MEDVLLFDKTVQAVGTDLDCTMAFATEADAQQAGFRPAGDCLGG